MEALEPRQLLSATVSTDQLDYAFGSTAQITGQGFAPGETVQLQVRHAPGTPGSNDNPQNQAWLVVDGGAGDRDGIADGNIQTTWVVDDPDAVGATYLLTATGMASHEVASASFTDSATVTPATGGTNISADKAANAASPQFTTLGDMVITEGATNDFATAQSNKTVILSAPTGWAFNPGVGDISSPSGDITATAIDVASGKITITLSTRSSASVKDTLTISGVQVRANSGVIGTSAKIVRLSGTIPGGSFPAIPGITAASTSFGALSQVAGDATALTLAVSSTLSTGVPSTFTATAYDQFGNTATSYRGTVHFSNADPMGPALPGDYTFVSGDNGTHIFTNGLTLKTLGTQSVSVVDTLTAAISGSCSTTVNPARIGTANSAISGATLGLTAGVAVPAGNTIIIAAAIDSTGSGAASVIDSRGNTYSTDASVTNSNGIRTLVFSARVTTALLANDAITLTFTETSTARAASAFFVPGLWSGTRKDVSITGSGYGASLSSGSVTTNLANEFLVGAMGIDSTSDSVTATSSFTALSPDGIGGARIIPEYRIVSSAGPYAATATLSAPHYWAAALVAYKQDVAAPTTSADLSGTAGDNGWYSSDVQVTLSASDAGSSVASTWYRIGTSGAFTQYSVPFTLSTEGTGTVEFYSVDTVGNAQSTQSQTIKIDKTAPSVSVDSVPASTLGQAVTISGSANDLLAGMTSVVTVSIHRASDNAVLASGPATINGSTWSYNYTPTQAGAQSATATGQDLAGNSATSTPQNFTVDAVPTNESVSINPATSNVGEFRTITTVSSDSNGATDISRVVLGVRSTVGNQVLYAAYNSLANSLSLYTDNGMNLVGTYALGSAHTLSNSWGTLDCQNTTVVRNGNTLTINWSIALKATMSGANGFVLQSIDSVNATTGYQAISGAIWQVSNPAANAAPVNVSGTSATSSVGEFRTITTVSSDSNGATDISRVVLGVHSTVGNQVLYAMYNSLANSLSLYTDNGMNLVGTYALGSAHTLSNSWGTLDCQNTTVVRNGNTLTINWSIALKATMSGANGFVLQSIDSVNATTGYQAISGAIWQVSNPAANAAPVNVSGTSATSSVGEFRTITTVSSDSNGATDISRVVLGVRSTVGNQVLYAAYNSLANSLSLYTDNGMNLVGTYALGSAHTLSNSWGTLDCQNTTVVRNGNTLTINWSISLKATMSGTNGFVLQSIDSVNATTGYQSILGAKWDILA